MTSPLTAVLVEKFGNSFSGYHLETGELAFRAQLPAYPHEFVVDPRGALAYVGHYGVQTFAHEGAGGHEVFVVDIARGEHVASLDCAPHGRIHGVQVDQHGRVYALSERDNVLLVFDNPAKRRTATGVVPSGGVKSHLFVVSRDGENAYITHLKSHTVTRVRPHESGQRPLASSVGGRPEGCCLSRDESILYVASRDDATLSMLDARTMEVLKTVPTGEDPTRIYLSRDNRLFVTNYGERSIGIYDAQTLQELRRVPTVHKPIALAFHPSAPLAYIPLNDDSVAKLDLETLALSHAFATGKEPDGLTVLPG
ncbi:40-residue YVTN family beta-propeller repeat-containing protein [Variovorax sp. HW608]|uniref:cytochrome D1 domain-containing protein n=1 Tax=Variovorax sp. HW608 TaxID=1034889 RepID=UPI0008201218|nr:YncE family protein [Variovorax sp. HW608]SCK16660.1 40-residue YVTN family beta-propeller repeat-containing protein [Variovorax sp. HW608]